ncbi:hypothetical protein GTQ34_01820 [Muricauda sp. JGD-17]|uniref:Adenylosuccinate lyase n=1 Tax=Flagellimonas ochracea TaxID=2696472 RepID=A0A964T9D6_9FLAO|nr:hypothetical protein [Allomuricauda ochracea]NAY90643.1 hypothetical protein [Allomuricauda ochracea]
MTEAQLHSTLNSGRLSKAKIERLVTELEQEPSLTKRLFQEVLREDKEGDFNASWTFDHLMRKKLVYLIPFMDDFTEGLAQLQTDSCIRPMAHVCEMVCVTYFKKKDAFFHKHVSDGHLEKILTACFDWLISPINVAPKVFSMTSLYYLGFKFDWVHPELKLVLENTIGSGTAGYKNRAKKTLDMLVLLEH